MDSRPSGKRLTGMRILVAEDDEINRLIVENILQFEGASVQFSVNGQEAVDRVHREDGDPFDIVLMDVQMPVMDGYDATRRILGIAPGLPIIGVTAHALEADFEKCLQAGMIGHVTKPIDADSLIDTIRSNVLPGVWTSSTVS